MMNADSEETRHSRALGKPVFCAPMLGKGVQRVLLAGVFGVLLLGVGSPVTAQPKSDTIDSVPQRYWWTTGGAGVGGIGFTYAATGRFPVTDRAFVGGRFLYSKEIAILSPPATMWAAGPLVGILHKQDRHGQISFSSGGVMGVERRKSLIKEYDCGLIFCSEEEYETIPVFRALAIPLNAQVVFTPFIPYVGIGVEAGTTVLLPDIKMGYHVSVQLTVRLPR